MKQATDRLVEAYFSEEAHALKVRSAKSFKIAAAAGLTAMLAFAMCMAIIILSILKLNPLGAGVSMLLGAFCACLMLLLIPVAWIFIGRFIYLRSQLGQYVNQQMRPANT